MNSAIFLSVRTGSSRLPNKSVLKIHNKYTIEYVIDNLKKSEKTDKIILCTTRKSEDDILCKIAENNNIKVFRGSERNKIRRWYFAAVEYDVDNIVTVDGDDLFFDVRLADMCFHQIKKSDFVNGQGLYNDVYGFKIKTLQNILDFAKGNIIEPHEITRFLSNKNINTEKLVNVPKLFEKKDIRMTLDYEEDFLFFENVIKNIRGDLTLENILEYLDKNKEVININFFRDNDWQAKQNINMTNIDKGWRFKGNELEYLTQTLGSGFSAGEDGTMVERVEKLFAQKHNQNYAIGFNSGTSTLHAALNAFEVGVGDEVIVPALTPAMCGYSIWQTGATPVFCDVFPDTFLMNPQDIVDKITYKTKAIMVVHIYGLMCDMKEIMKIANDYNLYVVEDCAQCFLAEDDEGRISGTIGHVGSWSFENSKHLSCGDGGIVTTDDEKLAINMRQFGGVGFKNLTASSGKVRISRDKFQDPNWFRHSVMAYNYRMPELCGAVALAQTEKIEEYCEKRIRAGNAYKKVIEDTQTSLLTPQKTPEGFKHSYYTFGALFNPTKDVQWQTFRKKYMEYGGDGIYAAWKTQNQEPAFKNNGIGKGEVTIAEDLQLRLMQFTTNQKDDNEIKTQTDALTKTLEYFDK
jgi:perosamine synthetase